MSIEKPLITTPEPPSAPPFAPSQGGTDGTKEILEHEEADTNAADDTSDWGTGPA
jgi:hypothetical protein